MGPLLLAAAGQPHTVTNIGPVGHRRTRKAARSKQTELFKTSAIAQAIEETGYKLEIKFKCEALRCRLVGSCELSLSRVPSEAPGRFGLTNTGTGTTGIRSHFTVHFPNLNESHNEH